MPRVIHNVSYIMSNALCSWTDIHRTTQDSYIYFNFSKVMLLILFLHLLQHGYGHLTLHFRPKHAKFSEKTKSYSCTRSRVGHFWLSLSNVAPRLCCMSISLSPTWIDCFILIGSCSITPPPPSTYWIGILDSLMTKWKEQGVLTNFTLIYLLSLGEKEKEKKDPLHVSNNAKIFTSLFLYCPFLGICIVRLVIKMWRPYWLVVCGSGIRRHI